MYPLNENMQQLLIRYLDNEATEQETALVKEWLAVPENKVYFEELAKLHLRVTDAQSATPANVDIDAAWKKVEHRTKLNKKSSPLTVERHTPVWSFWLKIAAVLFIGTGILWWVARNDGNPPQTADTGKTLTAAAGDSALMVTLPDGSKVTLHSNSSLEYPENFSGDMRLVSLEGEAFFDIQRDTARPFEISAGNATVRVLGTSFLVKDTKDSGVTVQVKTGKVLLYPSKNANAAVRLEKGDEGFLAAAATEPVKQEINDPNFLSLYDNVLRFDNAPVAQVLKDLEKQFEVRFETDSATLSGCRITARYEESTLPEILETLKKYYKWDIQQQGQRIKIRGNGCR